MGQLDAKVAVVTGSGRGIGQQIALRLARDGASVVVNDLDEGPAKETIAMIAALGGRAVACNGDDAAADFGERLIGTAVREFGDCHIVVNNAGYTWDNVIQKMTDEQWDAILDVHLKAPFRILRAASEYLRRQAKQEAEAGRAVYRKVVNISSVSGTSGNAGQANYSSGKAGVIGLTRALSKEWGRYKVNVNAVAFGMIQTRLTEATADGDASIDVEGRRIKVGLNPDIARAAEKLIPMGRAGTPDEAAGAVYLFCIPESNYVTGEVLICGGGYRM
ncbi:MAG: SDR family NAD(P)-dependent oxidoreductase [Gemmatimonadales bacterium]